MDKILSQDDFKDFSEEIILHRSLSSGKTLSVSIASVDTLNGIIDLKMNFIIKSKFDKVVYCGDHLCCAIKEFNKLK